MEGDAGLLEKMRRYKQLSNEWGLFLYRPYPKQKEFHRLGKTKKERGLLAANQTGKTNTAANEVAIHTAGLYPDWWEGYRFSQGNIWWVGSETAELTRDGAQKKLLGTLIGKKWVGGAIPSNLILDFKMARGTPEAVELVKVKNQFSGVSEIVFKAYADGREKWQAGTIGGVWFDEEPPEDIYTEGYTRTVKSGGPVISTFTPLKGLSTVVLRFPAPWNPIPEHQDRALVNMTLDDVPPWPEGHFTDEDRRRMLEAYPAHELEARTKGYPMLGSGRVFITPEDDISIPDFPIPKHFFRIGGLDFGWDHPTAACELAIDREKDVIYITRVYRRSQEIPAIHASVLKTWGDIPWAWPHDALQHDKGSGEQLANLYKREGLSMLPERASFHDGRGNGVEAGVMEMAQGFQKGKIRVFKSCSEFFEEYRSYHRKDGKLVKLREDIISAVRYAYMMQRFAKQIEEQPKKPDRYSRFKNRLLGRTWMSA